MVLGDEGRSQITTDGGIATRLDNIGATARECLALSRICGDALVAPSQVRAPLSAKLTQKRWLASWPNWAR